MILKKISMKDLLADVLEEITEDKSFDDVTVKEIVTMSRVNRQTFYYHFQDKFDCLAYLFDREAQKIVQKDSPSWIDIYFELFDHIIKHQIFFQHVAKSQAYSLFTDFILETIDLNLKSYINKRRKYCKNGHLNSCSGLQLFEYGLQGEIVKWFRDGLRENPELIVNSIAKISNQQLALLFDDSTENLDSGSETYNSAIMYKY